MIVAYDIFEHRIYGAPGEKRHRILWVDDYKNKDGSTPDLDWLLDLAKKDLGVDGGSKTIHIRPLMYAD
jgi:hypothetical protein